MSKRKQDDGGMKVSYHDKPLSKRGELMRDLATNIADSIVEKAIRINGLPPTHAIVAWEDQKYAFVVAPPTGPRASSNDEEHKNLLAEGIRLKLREDAGLFAYVVIAEAWYVTRHKDDVPLKLHVRDMEDRKEALVISGETRDGDGLVLMREIERDAEGKISSFKPAMIEAFGPGSGGETRGRFSGLFHGPVDGTVGMELMPIEGKPH